MAEYQITSWRDLPSLVVAREGDEVVKAALPARFMEAIDEAAMRLGDTGADAYLNGWERSEWAQVHGDPAEVAAQVLAALEARWDEAAVTDYLDALGPSAPGA